MWRANSTGGTDSAAIVDCGIAPEGKLALWCGDEYSSACWVDSLESS
jgi:hypothetical protein